MFHHVFQDLPRHIALKFDENQPRDSDGKFTKSKMFRGAGEGSSTTGKITWVTPDKATAKGYADKRVNGKVHELEVTLGNVFDAGHDARKVTPSKFAVEVLTKAKAAKLVDDKTALQLRADFLKDMDKAEVEIHSLWADDEGKKKVAALLSGAGFDTLQLSEGDKPTYGLIKKEDPFFELTGFAKVFKDNPYRDAAGKYTSKEKAAYQVISLDFALKDLAAHIKSQMESTNLPLAEMLKTEEGKKLVKAGAIAYYKHAKHSELSGDTPETLANFVSGSLDFQGNHLPAVQEALKKSLASKKAWDIIGKDNAIKGLDKDILPLLDVDTEKMTDKEKLKHNTKLNDKYQHYKKNFMAVGGNDAEFDAIYEKKLESKKNGTYEPGEGTSTKPFKGKTVDTAQAPAAAPTPKPKGPNETDLEAFGLKNPNDYDDTASYEKDKAKALTKWKEAQAKTAPTAPLKTQAEADDELVSMLAKPVQTTSATASTPTPKKQTLPDSLLTSHGLKPKSEYGTADDYLAAKEAATDSFFKATGFSAAQAENINKLMGHGTGEEVVKAAQAETKTPTQLAWVEKEHKFDNVATASALAKQFAKANIQGVDENSDTFKEMQGSWEKAKEYLKKNNLDPAIMYVKQKAAAKAEVEQEAIEAAKQALAQGVLQPAEPAVPKYTPAKNNIDAKEQNVNLGVHYYTTVLEKGKESAEAKSAYAEWQKTKDYLKGDPSFDQSSASGKQKQQATNAFNAKKNAVQAAAAAELQAKVDAENAVKAKKQKAIEDYAAAVVADAMNDDDSQSANLSKKKMLMAQKTAETLGIPVDELKKASDAAQAKAVASKKAAAAVKEFMKNAGQNIKDLDNKTFSEVEYGNSVGAKAFMSHQQKELSKLTAEEQKAVIDYTGGGYKEQNKTTAGTKGKGQSANAKLVNSGMDKMTLGTDVKLRRNMAQKWFFESFGITNFESLKLADAEKLVGKLYTEKAFSSTSKDLSFSGGFTVTGQQSGMLKMNIRAHKDIQGLDVQSISQHAHESEVILNRGVTYVIRAIRRTGSSSMPYEVDVDAIGHIK